MGALTRWVTFILGSFFLSWVTSSSIAFARPGGGQNYSSGGGSGGGGWSSSPSFGGSHDYSSGGGSGDFGPVSAIAVGVFLIILVYSSLSKNKPARRRIIMINPVQSQQRLLQLQKQDPGFSLGGFLERTKATMARVNDAWVQNSMEAARRLISDGVFVRFQTQLGLLRNQGLRNFMLDWKVVGTEFLAAESDSLWDTVHIKVRGQARDIDVPAQATKDQAVGMARHAPLDSYEEIWSFIRRRGKLSKAGVPVLEGHCPNCGADLPISDSVRCDHCQAIVNSGEHDFVLSEITQPEEWNIGSSNQAIAGLEDLQKRDTTISRQELEDRASVIFWKWIEARATGNLEKLARFCFLPVKQPETQTQLWLMHSQLQDVAVGSADVRQVETNVAGQRDRVWVEVRWSASVNGSEPQNMHHFLALTRSNQAFSQRGLSCLDCPVCSGPLNSSDAVVCSYCGENIAGAKYEWALESVTSK